MARPRVYDQRTMISARLDDDLVEQIDEIADAANMSRTALISAMLEYCVEMFRKGEVNITVSEPTLDVSAKPRSR